MQILITKQNQDFFKAFDAKIKFVHDTEHTCTFNVSKKKFEEIYKHLKAKGVNPYAAMAW